MPLSVLERSLHFGPRTSITAPLRSKGLGLVSTALVASVGNAITFRKGRDLAAWLGLVPRQHSTGGRPKLLGISKQGNEYLRRMLLHSARSVMMQVERNPSVLGYGLLIYRSESLTT
jgi:transposase